MDATPPENGTLVVLLTEGPAVLAAPEVLAVGGQPETLNLSGPHAGRFNVTVLYYVGGKLSDLVTVPNLAIQARYRFYGTITDAAGHGVAGATVTLTNGAGAVLGGTTDPNGAYAIDSVVPDFFVDGDTLVLAAASGGRVTSAEFVATVRGSSQTANLVLDTSPPEPLNIGLVGLAGVMSALAVVLLGIVVWQRRELLRLRRRLP